ncbi:MAG: D-2-hydroxyacid dehydrogenase [Pseudomonadota bacterium]
MSPSPRIVLAHGTTAALETRLRARCPQAELRTARSYDALSELLSSFRPDIVYAVRFAGNEGFPSAALTGPGGPAWIANGGVGTDHLGQWDTHRTTVTNAAGVAAGMMAEYVLGGFLHFTLDVPGLQADKAAKVWAERRVRPLAEQTLLIVGLGQTGQALAKRAKAFGMRVIGTRARPREMPHVDEVHAAGDLAALLPRADFIAVATPLTSATRGLIGPAEIAAMKPGVVLADVSRGGVVDQSALRVALTGGPVAAAVLDVFEVEPLPATSPLWETANVLISPHCSSVHAGWEEASFDMFLDNLDRWTEGAPLLNIVDPQRGY